MSGKDKKCDCDRWTDWMVLVMLGYVVTDIVRALA